MSDNIYLCLSLFLSFYAPVQPQNRTTRAPATESITTAWDESRYLAKAKRGWMGGQITTRTVEGDSYSDWKSTCNEFLKLVSVWLFQCHINHSRVKFWQNRINLNYLVQILYGINGERRHWRSLVAQKADRGHC